MHAGSCHCGRIAFEVDGTFSEVMECNCSHCSRKGYLLWFVPRAKLELKTPVDDMSVYHFNKHVIDHHFCPDCGCGPLGFGMKGDVPMASINVRCLEDVDLATIKRIPFDGRSR